MTELEKQLLSTLRGIAEIAHCGGLAGMSAATALTNIRRATIPYFDRHLMPYESRVALAAAEAAQPVGAKPVATVRVTHKGYGMVLSTYVAYALPEGMHDVYAVPQPATMPDGWQAVPKVPTPAMRLAGERERSSHPTNVNPNTTWKAMLAAAPAQVEPTAPGSPGKRAWFRQASEFGPWIECAHDHPDAVLFQEAGATPATGKDYLQVQDEPPVPGSGRGAMFIEFLSAHAAKAGHKELAAELLAAIRAAGESGIQGLLAPAEPACHIAEVSDEEVAIACTPAQRLLLREGMQLYAAPVAMPDTQAAMDVLAERKHQVESEGWTPEKDDQYSSHVLSVAAGCYAMYTLAYPAGDPPQGWPFDPWRWKPSDDTRRNYVKAAALLLAEIERIDRAGARLAAEAEGGNDE